MRTCKERERARPTLHHWDAVSQAVSLAVGAAEYEATAGSYTVDCAGARPIIHTTDSFASEQRIFGGGGGDETPGSGIVPYTGGSLDGFIDPRQLRELELTAPREGAENLLKVYSKMGEIWENRDDAQVCCRSTIFLNSSFFLACFLPSLIPGIEKKKEKKAHSRPNRCRFSAL